MSELKNDLGLQIQELERTINVLKQQYLEMGSASLLPIISELEKSIQEMQGLASKHDAALEIEAKRLKIANKYISVGDLIKEIREVSKLGFRCAIEFKAIGMFAKIVMQSEVGKDKFSKLTIHVPYIVEGIDPLRDVKEIHIGNKRFCYTNKPIRHISDKSSLQGLIIDTNWIRHLNDGSNLDLVYQCVTKCEQKQGEYKEQFLNQYSTTTTTEHVNIMLGDLLKGLNDIWCGTKEIRNTSQRRTIEYNLSKSGNDRMLVIRLVCEDFVGGKPPRRRDEVIELKLPKYLKFVDGSSLGDVIAAGREGKNISNSKWMKLMLDIDLEGFNMQNGCFKKLVDDCIRAGKVVDNSSEPIVQ